MRGQRHKRVGASTLSLIMLSASIAAFNSSLAHPSNGQADPGGKTTSDGVYTDAQHLRGQEVAKASCVSCHGEGLAGSEAPSLFGPDFVAAWSGRTLGELFEKIQTTMPADKVGSLKPEQSADLVAHILKLNDFPAGASELGTDGAALKLIKIRAQK